MNYIDVRYHNRMNEVQFGVFNEKELDIFFTIVHKMKEQGTKKVTLTFDEIKDLSGYVNHNKDRFVRDLRSVYKKLISLTFLIIPEKNVYTEFVLFTDYTINANTCVVDIAVNERFKFILNEIDQFTKFDLLQFVSLKNKYAKQIFKFLKKFEQTGVWIISIDEFRHLLDIPKSYQMSDVDKKVLNPAIKEIMGNESIQQTKTIQDLRVEKIKNGVRVEKLKFIFTKNKSQQLQIVPPAPADEATIILHKAQFLQTMLDGLSKQDLIKLLSMTDEKNILDKYFLMKTSKQRIDNVMGFMVTAIKEDYSAPPSKKQGMGSMDKRVKEKNYQQWLKAQSEKMRI